MKKRILIGSIIILILSAIPIYAQAPYQKSSNSVSNWRDLTRGDTLLQKVILCESGGNFNAIGKAGEIGLLQYMPNTWDLWTSKINKDLDINNPKDQIEVYFWAMNQGYSRHWTCLRKILSLK